MPFVSQNQWQKMAILMKQGKISKEKFDEWAKATKKPFSKLPVRVGTTHKPKSGKTKDLARLEALRRKHFGK